MKISVIGTGKVGGTTAFALVSRGVAEELVLVGRDRQKALGEAYDLLHAAAFIRPMRIRAGQTEDTANSDIILLAASVAPDVLDDRLASADANAQLLRDLVPPLAALSPKAIFVVLTNPVDVCTWVTLRASGLPANHVMGTGTLIDTGRFRALLSQEMGINAIDIRAYILGEHGQSQFPALSVASAGGVHLPHNDATIRALFEETRRGGHQVMRYKGYTNYAIAMSATLICEAINDNAHTIMPVSTRVDDFQGVSDVCLSLPCVIGRGGVERVLSIELSDDEAEAFRQSAAVLKEVQERVG